MNASVSRWFYNAAYRFSTPNWDNGKIPPELAKVAKGVRAGGRALDMGCGTGTQSLYLAQHGWSVVGVDLAPEAIERARDKARQAGMVVDFQIGDVTRLALAHTFDLVVDVGCFHGLEEEGRKLYANNLVRLTHPGSTFLMYAFDRHGPFGIGVTQEEVRHLFGLQFNLRRNRTGNYLGGRPSRCFWFESAGGRIETAEPD